MAADPDACVQRHKVLITDRGGRSKKWDLENIATVEWERAADRKTQATITLTGKSCDRQRGVFGQIEPKRHEMVLFRGKERVWEGPIRSVASTSTTFKIIADDVIEYLYGTALSKRWPNSEEGGEPIMTERLREIIEYELTTDYDMPTSAGTFNVTRWEQQDPPANILPYLDIRVGTTLTRSVTEAFEMSLGEHLWQLGRSKGVSFTTVGRRIVVWDGVLGRLRTVTEKDFTNDFRVVSSGDDHFGIAHVIATQVAGSAPVVGHARNTKGLDYYGPWEQIISVQDENANEAQPTQDELNSIARANLSGTYPVPIELLAADGSSLILGRGIGINQLVAGVEIPVRARRNLRNVSQVQRLATLKVTETAEGETIVPTMEAVGEVTAA